MLRAEAQKIYANADSNQTGMVSKNALKKMIQKDPVLRQKLVPGGWGDFFDELDEDGDYSTSAAASACGLTCCLLPAGSQEMA